MALVAFFLKLEHLKRMQICINTYFNMFYLNQKQLSANEQFGENFQTEHFSMHFLEALTKNHAFNDTRTYTKKNTVR